jgi:pimeloyl-ACP methyl ester carboxylesterase
MSIAWILAGVEQEVGLVEVGGQKTRVLDRAAPPPARGSVVVLHGWGGRIESMAPVIECLAPSLRVVALDLPGFGEAPAPESPWGTPEYALYVREVVRHTGLERAHFVGHSYGAKTALYLAAAYPEVVERLVLVGSSGLKTPPTSKARALRALSMTARTAGRLGPFGRSFRDATYDRIASDDYKQAGELRPILVKVVNEDMSGLLPRVQASTLLVWGAKDDAVPVAHARTMERLIPDAGLVLFEEAGHFAYLDEPARFCRIVRHFLCP